MKYRVKYTTVETITIILFAYFSFVGSAFTQMNSGLVLSVGEIGAFNFKKHNANAETTFKIGNQWNNELSSFRLSFAYRFSGNMWNKPSFTFQTHLIGASLEGHFSNIEKRFRPIIGLTILTGISSNYLDKPLHPINFYPIYFESPKDNSVYRVTIYNNTILDLDASVGLSCRINKHFFLTTYMEYGIKIMKIDRELIWQIDPEIDHDETFSAINFMKIQLGVTYFPPKRNKKETPKKSKTL